jgi:hypothetical protein
VGSDAVSPFDGRSTVARVALGAAFVALAVGGVVVAALRLPSVVGVVGALAGTAGTALALILFVETVGARQRERDRERRAD